MRIAFSCQSMQKRMTCYSGPCGNSDMDGPSSKRDERNEGLGKIRIQRYFLENVTGKTQKNLPMIDALRATNFTLIVTRLRDI